MVYLETVELFSKSLDTMDTTPPNSGSSGSLTSRNEEDEESSTLGTFHFFTIVQSDSSGWLRWLVTKLQLSELSEDDHVVHHHHTSDATLSDHCRRFRDVANTRAIRQLSVARSEVVRVLWQLVTLVQLTSMSLTFSALISTASSRVELLSGLQQQQQQTIWILKKNNKPQQKNSWGEKTHEIIEWVDGWCKDLKSTLLKFWTESPAAILVTHLVLQAVGVELHVEHELFHLLQLQW